MLGIGLYNYNFWERKILTLYFLWGISIIGLEFDIGSKFEYRIRECRYRERSFKNNSRRNKIQKDINSNLFPYALLIIS